MNIAILGYGTQGASALSFYKNNGHHITVCDKNEDLVVPDGVDVKLGPDSFKGLDKFDVLVRSPSIHPRQITEANPEAPEILQKTTSNTNLFMENCPTRNIIGVTGTKGKGTSSTLIAEMLKADGNTVHLGGNIGTPPLEMLSENISPEDWIVLELANFQLIDIKYSPKIAVCVMVVPEHLDWHKDVDEYVAAKQQLFRWQSPEDFAVFYPENELSKSVTEVSAGMKIPYYKEPGARIESNSIVIEDQRICDVSDIKLLGRHNWQNVCAATTAVWQVTKNTTAIAKAIKEVSGLPFRLELVREIENVKYYNDSFGTTPETAIVAIEAFSQPKILLLGGSDKKADYKNLANTVKNGNVRNVITIGVTGPKIASELRKLGYENITEGGQTMQEIVNDATNLAQAGDIVLLSTGCASFDMFKDYKDRGEQFNSAVRSIASGA